MLEQYSAKQQALTSDQILDLWAAENQREPWSVTLTILVAQCLLVATIGSLFLGKWIQAILCYASLLWFHRLRCHLSHDHGLKVHELWTQYRKRSEEENQ